jgi:hypothetical protein
MISEREWTSIREMVLRLVTQKAGHRGNLITGKVIKRDPDHSCVWIEEFGDQPIPLVGFDYDVKSYDTDGSGTVNVKHYIVSPKTPDVGESVLVAMEMGAQSLPRCVGVIQGKNWIIPEDES